MGKFKQSQNYQRHAFLLTFFTDDKEIIDINGYILKKFFNSAIQEWQVSIYTPESYRLAEEFLTAQSKAKQKSLLAD